MDARARLHTHDCALLGSEGRLQQPVLFSQRPVLHRQRQAQGLERQFSVLATTMSRSITRSFRQCTSPGPPIRAYRKTC
eukprot:73204-Pleurochrysis_carterae.AAC.1